MIRIATIANRDGDDSGSVSVGVGVGVGVGSGSGIGAGLLEDCKGEEMYEVGLGLKVDEGPREVMELPPPLPLVPSETVSIGPPPPPPHPPAAPVPPIPPCPKIGAGSSRAG
jgi:hypothetical protein